MTKTILSSIFLACGAATAVAQPTIVKADMPSAGYNPRYSIGNVLGVDISQTGNNVTWDFTDQVPTAQRVDTFLSPNSVPFSYKLYFSSATVAQRQLNDSLALGGFTFTNAYNFYKATNSAYINQGFGAMSDLAPIPIAQVNNPADTIYKLPLTSTTPTDSCYSKSVVTIPTLLYWEHEQTRWTSVDGWGTLNTPFGSFQTLRVKSRVEASDTISVSTFGGFRFPTPATVEYKWLASGQKAPVMKIGVSELLGTETVTSVEYLDSLRAGVITIGVDKPVAHSLLLFPNPASDQVQVNGLPNVLSGATLEVFTLSGAKVISVPFAAGALSVNGLAAGMYSVQVVTADGVRHTGTVVVERK